MVDGTAIMSVGVGGLAPPQHLNTAGQGGHRVSARRIHIFQCHTVEGTSGTSAQTLQRFIGVFPFVMQVVAGTLRQFLPNRAGHSNFGRYTIGVIFARLQAAGKCFPGDDLKQEQQGVVETIEPDHRFAAVSVPMPCHRRSKNQVSLLHRNFFAFDNRVSSAALEYEPERREVVPVILGHLAGLQQLHGHKHGMRRRALSSVLVALIGRIDESEHAPLRFAVETVHIAYCLDRIVEVLPLPHMRQNRRVRILAVSGHVRLRCLGPEPLDV
jgi:hypothetical protein